MLRPGCRSGSLRVSSCSRWASSRMSTLVAKCRRIDASSVSSAPSTPPGSAQAPKKGSRARCHSSTWSSPSRTWSTTASVSWLSGTPPRNSLTGYRLIVVNCSGPVAGRPAARMFTDRSGSMPTPSSSSTRRLDVEAVLGAAGFRPFHRRAIALTGIAWTLVAMEILLIGFTLPLFGSIWHLSATWLGWIGAAALAGSLVGSLLLGRLADQIGRKRIFQASILWYSLLTALTALAWGPASPRALPCAARLLLADRPADRHRAVVDLPGPAGRGMAVAIRRRRPPRLPRRRGPPDPAGEPVLAGPPRPAGRGRRRARRHYQPTYQQRIPRRVRRAELLAAGASRRPAARHLSGHRPRVDRAQRLLLRPVHLAAGRADRRGTDHPQPLRAARPGGARAVPRLRRLAVAGGGLGPPADAGRLSRPRRRERAHLRLRPLHRRLRRRLVLRRLLQPRRLGRGVPLHLGAVPHPAAVDCLWHGRGRRQNCRHRRPLPVRLPAGPHRRHRLVAHLRGLRHGRRRPRHSARTGNPRRAAHMTASRGASRCSRMEIIANCTSRLGPPHR